MMPRQPRLRSADVLVWIYREKPEQFTINDIMVEFGLQRGEAQRRVNYMRLIWNAVRLKGTLKAHRRGRREIVYELTKWGNTYASKAQRTQGRARRSAGGKAAANPEDES